MLDNHVLDEEGAALAPPVSPIAPPQCLRLAALLSEPLSGRTMQVWSAAPGARAYACHSLKADPLRDQGSGAQPGDGICLALMEYPDAPNQPGFPVRWLAPGDVVQGAIVYRFI